MRQQHKKIKHQDIKQSEPQQKYRLGTISYIKLLAVLNRFFLFYVLVFKIFLCCWRLMYVCIVLVKVTEWPPIGKIAAHSAY